MVQKGKRPLDGFVLWQKAMAFMQQSYRIAGRLPRSEQFVLSQQLRGSALSVPSNIAEGVGRATRALRNASFSHSRGSLFEAQTQLQAAVLLKMVTEEEVRPTLELGDEIGRLLTTMLRPSGGN